ncbi:MAG TPA: PEP-CTERM sorting domain-containing protein [Candidatus Paceibacterota bacterium]|nr:PEP-CTERM sorting domain-containing protein [Verrucomicrobiota bacterium]HRY51856.1 PEP-CTERM sorting domain-containing protein [Candidatus Paceibacterota bacterium]
MKISTLLLGCMFGLSSRVGFLTASTLDQQYAPTQRGGLPIDLTQTVVQTFEVGLSGVLDRIDMEIARSIVPAPEGLTFEVRSTLPDGSPASSVLAGIFILAESVSTSFQFISVDLKPFGLKVREGDVLAMVLRTDDGLREGGYDPFVWHGDAPGDYSRGTVYIDRGTGFGLLSGYDLGFRTYIDTTAIPEPSSLALLFSGAVLMHGMGYGRKFIISQRKLLPRSSIPPPPV